MSAGRPALRRLARRLGILDSYRNVEGHDRWASDATREALAAAMGHDASSEATAEAALARLDREDRERIVEPVLVWREWPEGSPTLDVRLAPLAGARDYRIELRLEDGTVESATGRLPEPDPAGSTSLPLPLRPPHGYHDVRLVVDGPDGERSALQRLVMSPRDVRPPEEILGSASAYGIWANLYSVRARGDWGHGGLRELTRLGREAGDLGAAFVGVNPLHAVQNRGLEFSPYSPSSRLHRNVLYLDPEAVPELAEAGPARALLDDPTCRRRRDLLEARASIDHEAVLEAMLPVLRELHAAFCRSATPARKESHAAYLAREGSPLRDFATWEALAEHQAGSAGRDWRRWPEPLRDPRSAAVESFRREHVDEVDFRCWLQFELDRQLAETAHEVRAAGCTLGIYQDLALGSGPASADTWMDQDLYAAGAHVGSPPDAYAPEGQDWGFPPFDPHRLRADGYRAWARLLQAAFRHTGVLRIDHAMGLLRLFWIPTGRPGSEGAYVSHRAEELLGILALESRRSGAIVVAEDLGTLPPELPGLLADWGLLRSAVVHFERDAGRFRPTSHYPPRALASVSTHDLAPLAGYFDGRDLELRERAQPPDPAVSARDREERLARGRAERRMEREALIEALRAEGFLPDGSIEDVDETAFRDAVHAFLAAVPSLLVGVALDDLAGERDPVNLPGIPLEAHRSWSRRMAVPLEDWIGSAGLRAALEPLRSRFHHPRSGS